MVKYQYLTSKKKWVKGKAKLSQSNTSAIEVQMLAYCLPTVFPRIKQKYKVNFSTLNSSYIASRNSKWLRIEELNIIISELWLTKMSVLAY